MIKSQISLVRFLLYPVICSFLFSCAYAKPINKELEYEFNPMLSAVNFYRDHLGHLSAVKGSECPMYPSCSSYSIQCLNKHGLLIGWMMTCDRLLRCGRDELKLSPQIIVNEKWKCYDPVDDNDFWWYKEQD